MKKYKRSKLLILGLILAAYICILIVVKPFLILLSLGVLSASILYPVYKALIRYTHINKSLASFIIVTISAILVMVALIVIGTQVLRESLSLYTFFDTYESRQHIVTVFLESIGKLFENLIPGTTAKLISLSPLIDEYLKNFFAWIVSNIGTMLSSLSTFTLDALIFVITLYYLMRDGPYFKKLLDDLSPLTEEKQVYIVTVVESAIRSIVVGNFFIALIQGTLTGIGFALFGVPNSILFGMLAVFASLIPRIGTALIILPAALYLFSTGSEYMAIGLSLWGICFVGIVDNIIGPKYIGKKLGLHPLFILLSVIGGITLYGPAGIILGPLTITILIAFITIATPDKRKATDEDGLAQSEYLDTKPCPQEHHIQV
jgi:predicted PurR-regulated permease PerM